MNLALILRVCNTFAIICFAYQIIDLTITYAKLITNVQINTEL